MLDDKFTLVTVSIVSTAIILYNDSQIDIILDYNRPETAPSKQENAMILMLSTDYEELSSLRKNHCVNFLHLRGVRKKQREKASSQFPKSVIQNPICFSIAVSVRACTLTSTCITQFFQKQG